MDIKRGIYLPPKKLQSLDKVEYFRKRSIYLPNIIIWVRYAFLKMVVSREFIREG